MDIMNMLDDTFIDALDINDESEELWFGFWIGLHMKEAQ